VLKGSMTAMLYSLETSVTFILVKIVSGTFITLIFFLAHVFLLIFRF
jgi:hypothetical protein